MENIPDRITLIGECDEVVVNTYGVDGNAYSIMGVVQKAMQVAGVSKRARDVFLAECTSGNYENLLRVCDLWVTLVHVVPPEKQGTVIGALREFGLDPELQ